ncbi:MAG TPA: hypothetical protein VK149_12365 [Sideroxyarcus sp.]|nr:hypothetical protein [Sideroxyarcus sp.]
MGLLQEFVSSLPGSNEKNPLTGVSPSEFTKSTTTGNLSDNGFNTILALDPTISQQRGLNAIDKGLGGNGNIFSDKAMGEEAGIFNTVGKIIAASYLGDGAGDLAGNTATTSTTTGNIVQGAVTGGTAAGMNNQSVGEGALAGGVIGAMAPTTNTDPTTVTKTANGASATQETKSALDVAMQGAKQGAVQAGVNAGKNDQSVGDAIVDGALTGALTSGINQVSSPEIASMINGAVNNAVAADKAGQPIENGIFSGAVTGLAAGVAGEKVYKETGSKDLGSAAAHAAQGATGIVARNNLPMSPNKEPDPAFAEYMKLKTRGFSPQISDTINPIVLAAAGNGLTVEQTATTQLTKQNGGVSPLLIEGA